MKRLLLAALCLCAAGSGGAAAGPSSGGFSSPNVEFVRHLPIDLGGLTGARIVGHYLYAGGARGFSIYDITDPIDPRFASTTPTGFQFPNEDLDTNGKILVISEETPRGMLHVYDVENKTAPAKVGELTGVNDHTFSCVLDCRYAFGGYGSVVDITDPASPELVGDWRGAYTGGPSFDVTEVAPGRVLSASSPLVYLDARKDVADPRIVATGPAPDSRLMHATRWPNGGRDDFILVTGETPFSQRCRADSGAFMTFDARDYRRTHTFRMIDEYRPVNGTQVDGNPPANIVGCSSLWFREHPDWHNGGLVAAAFLEHGTRFLSVDGRGRISETGWFVPHAGTVAAAMWADDEIVYSIDTIRGIDILRVTSPPK